MHIKMSTLITSLKNANELVSLKLNDNFYVDDIKNISPILFSKLRIL